MKFIHTSDWHLGKILHEHSLIEDQKYILQRLLTLIEENPHDALIIAGDIYDRSMPSAEATDLFSWFITTLRSFSSIPIVIIPGNHDSALRLSYFSDLISRDNIFIQHSTENCHIPIEIKNTQFFGVPFLFKGSLTSDDVKRTHEDEIAEAISRISQQKKENMFHVFIGHLFTLKGLTSDSERHFVGTAEGIDPGLMKNFNYTALGHLHKPQKISDTIYYSGSLLKYSFSEHNDKKSILSVDLIEKTVRPIELPVLHDIVRLKDTLENILKGDEYLVYKNHYVEVELADASLVENPISLLRKRFPHILSVKQKNIQRAIPAHAETIIQRKNNSIEEDYELFHIHLYDKKPDKNKLALIDTLLKEDNQ